MASGTMRFYSVCRSGQTNVRYVIPNDLMEEMKVGNPHYERPMKTLILLHGFSGNESDWQFNGMAEDIAFRYNMAVFMPDGGNNFYLDRESSSAKYGTYVGKELVDYVRKTFGLSDKREDTFIGGLSMGGFGALHTALAFPETFAGAVALSSALVIHELREMKEGDTNMLANMAYYEEVFGDMKTAHTTDKNPEVLFDSIVKAGGVMPRIYMACGTEDFLYNNNIQFRDYVAAHRRPQDDFLYEEGPGIHEWRFWNEYIFRGMDWILS